MLSLGRSFRTSQPDQVICKTQSECWVQGRIASSQEEPKKRIGFQRVSKKNKFRIDGQDATNVAQIARVFPVQIIHPDSHRLLTAGPAVRRSFLDWGCFYEDHGFYLSWRQYRRALAQYNVALKKQLGRTTLKSIEMELAIHGQEINGYRRRYLNKFINILPFVDALWPDANHRQIDYDSGWNADIELHEALEKARHRSLRAGSSVVGPHRAELMILHNTQPTAAVFSRGQIKRVTVAMLLAQTALFEDSSEIKCALLIDDIASELDMQSLDLVSRVLSQRGGQCFITGLTKEELIPFSQKHYRMFHVKHGYLSELV